MREPWRRSTLLTSHPGPKLGPMLRPGPQCPALMPGQQEARSPSAAVAALLTEGQASQSQPCSCTEGRTDPRPCLLLAPPTPLPSSQVALLVGVAVTAKTPALC